MKEKAKSCAEIAEELGTTRQNANQVLKRGLTKLYNKMLYERQITHSPSETLKEILNFFEVTEKEDLDEFYKILPNKIKEEVKNEYENP